MDGEVFDSASLEDPDGHLHPRAAERPDFPVKTRQAFHFAPANLEDDVPRFHPGPRGGPARADPVDENAPPDRLGEKPHPGFGPGVERKLDKDKTLVLFRLQGGYDWHFGDWSLGPVATIDLIEDGNTTYYAGIAVGYGW